MIKKPRPTLEELRKKIEHMKLRQRAKEFKDRHGVNSPEWDYENDRPKGK